MTTESEEHLSEGIAGGRSTTERKINGSLEMCMVLPLLLVSLEETKITDKNLKAAKDSNLLPMNLCLVDTHDTRQR